MGSESVPRTKSHKSETTKRAGRSSSSKARAGAKSREGKHGKAGASLTFDRRSAASKDRRKQGERRQKSVPVAVEHRKLERRAKVNRRRQIDPTTCERDYSADELEFMTAMDEYKRTSGRMFPTCSEVLEVLRNLGYQKHPRAAGGHTSHALTDHSGPTPADDLAAV